MHKKIWKFESFFTGKSHTAFSSKIKAIGALEMWSRCGLNKFKIITDLEPVKRRRNVSDLITIEYDDGKTMSFNLDYEILNNAAGIILHHREVVDNGKR